MDCEYEDTDENKEALMERVKEHFKNVHYPSRIIPKNKIAEIEKAIKPHVHNNRRRYVG